MSSTKLTWLTLDCLVNANSAVKAQKTATTTAAKFKAQIPVIELGITTEIANRAEVQVKLDAATLRLTGAQAKLAAATTDVDKRVLTTAVASWTSATRAYGSKIRAIDQLIKRLEAAKLVAVNKPAELASNVTNARENAKLICYKGL
jgi:predicted  nucleic acid-binding Zn-ribbon protein